MTPIRACVLTLGLMVSSNAEASEPIRLVTDFSLSPDGKTLVLSWCGDIWTAPTGGGDARRLTRHAGDDRTPRFSPDGQTIAFTSNRSGSDQIYEMSRDGGVPEQKTAHTGGYRLECFFPDGSAYLASGSRDHFWRRSGRFFRVARETQRAEELLFDGYGSHGRVSPDGKRLLFCREGVRWWRKGYKGSQTSQVWIYDLDNDSFVKLLQDDLGYRTPVWRPDGAAFYYVGQQGGSFNLFEYDLRTDRKRALTAHEDDSVLWPTVSGDGSTLVYRHRFDLYRLDPTGSGRPEKIEILNGGEPMTPPTLRRTLSTATEAAFTSDGLEIAFVTGGDLWVMDTELREPRPVTATPEEVRHPVFSPDDSALYFVSDQGGQTDIWRAERHDSELYWWQNHQFRLDPVTRDSVVESAPRFSPDGETIAYERGSSLWLSRADGKEARELVPSWNSMRYDFSPDGRWISFDRDDADFNSDIWVVRVDGSEPPFNLSVHPDNDGGPVWSPNGKILAFTGRRRDQETDIYYVWLRADDAEEGSRDRTLAKALEKMEKERKKKGGGKRRSDDPAQKTGGAAKPAEPSKSDEPASPDAPQDPEKPEKAKATEEKPELPECTIDFAGIHDRIRRISIPDSTERGLFWLDEKRLAFRASIDGKRGIYTIEFPDELSPKLLTSKSFSVEHGLAKGKGHAGTSDGKPAVLSDKGTVTPFAFSVRQELDHGDRYRAGFDLAWRTMRDRFYDERLGNRNWDEIRRKYADAAQTSPDAASFGSVVSMMLGELNGSHLGFTASGAGYRSNPAWIETTVHLGLRYDPKHKGPGWRVRDVIKGGPTDRVASRVAAGEIVLAVDGQTVDPSLDVSTVLNGTLDRDIVVRVQGADGIERDVTVRPISYGNARRLLYEMWIDHNRKLVDEGSQGTLGYLHIRGMNWRSFLRFEEELYRVGYGKDGLVIDVRDNGGGSTTDHLLTALTQPRHAVTVPRGGEAGYPHDRRVYATWHKPIVVLCNQNSFSNAEIFAHAVKTLGRGQVVGVRTAGGVISTGGTRIMDLGFLRLPFRGWFLLKDGEDMELNGTMPDVEIWPQPGDLPEGKDDQLSKGIEVLLRDVKQWKAKPRPEPRKATERR